VYLNVTVFSNAISGITAHQVPQSSKYLDTAHNYIPYVVSGNNLFQSDAALFCKSTLRLVSSNAAYSQVIIQDFTGTVPAISPITLGSPGQYAFNSTFDLTGCIASGRTHVTNCGAVDNVWMYKNSAGFPYSFNSQPATITVENPFACSLSTSSPATISAAPGGTAPFSFTLYNGGNRDLSVYSINLADATFTGLTFSPSTPFTISAGSSAAISGSVSVPSSLSSGAYPLRLNVRSNTASADCSGSIKPCDSPSTVVVNINIGSVPKPNYEPRLSAQATAYVGVPFRVDYNTVNTGASAAVSSSTTRLSFTDLSSPIDTAVSPLGINITQANNAFLTCTSAGSKTLSETVDLNGNINESNEGDNFASLSINCQPASLLPNYIISGIANPVVYINENFISNVTTQNIGGVPGGSPSTTNVSFPSNQHRQISVPDLAGGASFTSPATFLCQNSGPNTEVAYADALAQVNESNELDNALSVPMTCWPVPVGPEHCILSFASHSMNFTSIGDSAQVVATCTDDLDNPTACPALAWSHDATPASATILPNATPRTAPPAKPTTTLTINQAIPAQLGKHVNAVSTEPAHPLVCTPLAFNINSYGGVHGYSISCNLVNHDPIFFANETAQVRASCLLDGEVYQCPALNWSTTLAGSSMNPTSTPNGASPMFSTFSSPLLPPPPILPGQININCADPVQCNASCNISFNFSIAPDTLACGLVNHSNRFAANDSSMVEGNCSKVGLPGQLPCPRLHWYTDISGGSLDPAYTNRTVHPLTNFTTHNAPVPQSGSINAQTVDGIFNFACANPILINVSKIGPDYVISHIQPVRDLTPIGNTVDIELTVTNIGNVGVANTTTTTMYGANCTASGQDISKLTQGLGAGETTSTMAFTCTCGSPGLKRVTAEANYPRTITESEYGNNQGIALFYCGNPYAPVCADFV